MSPLISYHIPSNRSYKNGSSSTRLQTSLVKVRCMRVQIQKSLKIFNAFGTL